MNLLRIASFPAHSITISELEKEIDHLKDKEGFIPDVIVIDYADLLAPEVKGDHRNVIDDIWKNLRRIAEERDCLVVTGSQSNRSSMEKAKIDEWDTAEDIRKLAHVTLMMVLDQTPKEKEVGVMRIGLLEHRFKRFNKRTQLLILQQLDIGQPMLDGEIIKWEKKTQI